MKKLLSVFLALIMATSNLFSAAAVFALDEWTGAPALDLKADYKPAEKEVEVTVEAGAFSDLGAITFYVEYDESLVEVKSASYENIYEVGTEPVSVDYSVPGEIVYFWYDSTGETGANSTETKEVISVVFGVKDGVTGKAYFELLDVDFTDKTGNNSVYVNSGVNTSEVEIANYISQFNFVLPNEVDSVPAPVIGAKPVTESGHFGFEELGDGVMYADYYISTADNSVVYEFEPGKTYVEKVEITLFDGYSADANTKLPAYLEGFELDVENSGENTYVYTRTTAFETITVEEVTIGGTVDFPTAFEPMNKAEFTVSIPTSSAYYTFLEIKDGVSKEIEFPTDETYKPGYDYSQNITITLKEGYVFKEGFSAEDVILGEEFKDFVVTIYPTAISLNRYTDVEATISSIDLEGITGRPTLGEEYAVPTVTTTTAGVTIDSYNMQMSGDNFEGGIIIGGKVYVEEIHIGVESGYKFAPEVAINGADGFTIAQQTHRAIVLTRATEVEKTEVTEVNFENFEAPATGKKAVYPVCSDGRIKTTVRIYDVNGTEINPGDTYLGNTRYFVEVTLELTEESKDFYKFGSGTQVPEGFAVDGDVTNYIVCTYMVDTAPAVLTGITVTGTPKTAYVYGENFDAAGLTVTANYNDGTTKEVTDYAVETKLVPGVTEVTVSYDGKTAVIGGISVAKKELAITGIKAADRVYNGTTEVAVTGGELVGVIPGDDVYVIMPTEGSVATANAGEKIVAVAKPELMGAQADYYTLAEISGVSVNITAKPLAANMAENPADVTYNGKEQKPAVTVKDGEVLLIEGKDYNVVYKDNVNIGTAEAVITGIGNYSGSVTKYFVIMQRNISVLLTANDKVYDGTNSAEVVFSGFEGVLDADEDKVFFDVNAGQSIFEGSYVGTHKVSFAGGLGESALSGENAINYRVAEVKVINEAKITEAEQIITVSSGEHKAMKNNSVSIGGWVISNAGADAKITYTLGGSYADVSISGTTLKVGKNAQLGSITIKAVFGAIDVNGDGVNEYGAAETSFTVKIVNKNDVGLNAEDVTKTYGDADFEISAVISEEAKAENGKWNWTITGDAVDMEPGKETAEFAINKAGTAAVTVSYESEHYFGEKTITITVNAKDIVNNDFEEITSSYEYTGSEIRPEVVCKTGLVKDIDYTVEYSNNTEAGTASVIIKGINNYKGTVNRSFKITAKAVEESDVTVNVPAEGYVYDGTAKEPSVSVAGLTEGVDYTVTYANNVNAGKAKVTVTFKGNYSGSYEEIFEIAQASVTVIFAAEDKAYDGTTAAEVAFSRFEDVAEADKESITYAGTSSGNFASPYAGIHEVVFTGNAVLAGAKAQNYKVAAVKVEKAEITAAQQTVTVPAGQQSVAQNTTKDVKALATFVEGAHPIFLAETLPEGVTLENGVLSVGASAAIGEVITVKVRSTAIDLNGDSEVEYLKAEDKFISFVIVAKADAEVSVTPSGIVKTYGDKDFGVVAEPANTAGEGTYSWVSSDESVISLEGANTKNPTFKVGKAGTATVTVTYEDETYLGSAEVKITVNPKDIAGFTVSGLSDAVYTGSVHTPAVTVKDGSKTLVQGTDYTVNYANNVNAGTAVVTVTGMGNYSGTIEKTFAITAKSIADVTVSGIGVSYEYADGEAIRPEVTVTDGSTVLKENIDYTAEYSNNTEPGKASVTIKGKGNYSGTIEKTFVITAKNIVPTVEISGSYTYTGKPVHPAVTVKYGDKELSGGIDYAGTDKDYSISYENNVNAGTAKLTVTAKGANYTWTAVTKEFTINPADYTVSVNDSYSLRVGKGISTVGLPKNGNGVNSEKVEGTITLYYGSEILTDEISAELAAGEYSVTWKFVPYANANYVSEEKTGGFTLKVVEKESQTIEAPYALDFVYGGADKEIGAKVTVGDGTISYSSSNESVATVDANGKVSVHSAGTAVITVTAAETENYAEETKDIIVTVARKNVTKPTANSTVFTYNGEEQTYAVIANDAYTVSGNVAKEAGSYVVTVALKDKANTQWADGTTADITFDFVINKAKVEKPNLENIKFTYNGEEHRGVTPAEGYIVVGNGEKEAGDYNVTVTLDKNYEWADGSEDVLTGSYTVEKATVTITAKNYVVTEGDKAPVLDESSYAVTGLAEGESLAVKPVIGYAETPNMNKAGKVEIVVFGAEVPNTNNYNTEIVYVSGVLTIEEKKDYDDDDSDNIIIDLTKPSTERENESNPATGAPAMLAGFALLAAAAAFIGKKK